MKTKNRKLHFYRSKFFSGRVLKVKVDYISLKNTLTLVEEWVDSNKQYQITTPNPEHIVMAQGDYRFREIINHSPLAVADGVGLMWAAKLLKLDKATKGQNDNGLDDSIIYHRTSGVDLMVAMCKLAAQKKWRVFLLGAKNNNAAKAVKTINNLTTKTNSNVISDSQLNNEFKLTISYFKGSKNIKNETSSEHRETITRINKFRPHLLFVAYGAPMQEKWIAENLAKLKVKIAMGVGGSFDYLSGSSKRAPKIIRKTGLEWFWRLVHEPWRWRRQMRLIKFVYLVVKERLELLISN